MKIPFTSFCNEVKSLCKPLNKIGITYLSLTRVYKTGERVYLTSEARILEYNFDRMNLLRAANEMHPDSYNSNQILIWSTLPDQSYFQDIEHLQLGNHGMYLFDDKKEDYCDSFGFATAKHNETIINSYLSNLELLRNFMAYFHENASSMIEKARQEKIFLPFNQQKPIITLRSEELENLFSTNKRKYKFSRRQLECIDLLIKGFTAKEIARQLNISFRTVETYIELLKRKLNCKNKIELIIQLMKISYTSR